MIACTIRVPRQELVKESSSTAKIDIRAVPFPEFYTDMDQRAIVPGETEALLEVTDNGNVTKYHVVIEKIMSYVVDQYCENVYLAAVVRFTELSPFGDYHVIPYSIGPQVRIGSSLGVMVYVDIEESRVYDWAENNFSYCVTERRGVRYKFDTARLLCRKYMETTSQGTPNTVYIQEGILVLFTAKELPSIHDRDMIIKYFKQMYSNIPGRYI